VAWPELARILVRSSGGGFGNELYIFVCVFLKERENYESLGYKYIGLGD
jgi:hypothetical protein